MELYGNCRHIGDTQSFVAVLFFQIFNLDILPLPQVAYDPVARGHDDSKRQEAADEDSDNTKESATQDADVREGKGDQKRNQKPSPPAPEFVCKIHCNDDGNDSDSNDKNIKRCERRVYTAESGQEHNLENQVHIQSVKD